MSGAINQHTMLIRVSDNGPGVPDDVIDQVQSFLRLERRTGLGLAVLASIVQQHGGTVHVANRDSGGAQFTVVLPVESTAKGG